MYQPMACPSSHRFTYVLQKRCIHAGQVVRGTMDPFPIDLDHSLLRLPRHPEAGPKALHYDPIVQNSSQRMRVVMQTSGGAPEPNWFTGAEPRPSWRIGAWSTRVRIYARTHASSVVPPLLGRHHNRVGSHWREEWFDIGRLSSYRLRLHHVNEF